MNRKQKVLTVIAAIVLLMLARQYFSAHHLDFNVIGGDTGPNAQDLRLLMVGGLVLGVVYTGLFFVLKK